MEGTVLDRVEQSTASRNWFPTPRALKEQLPLLSTFLIMDRLGCHIFTSLFRSSLERQVVPLLVEIRQHVRSLKQDVDAMRLHVLQLEAAQQGGAPLPPPGPVALPPLLSDLPLRTLRDVEEAERLLADVSVRQALKLQLLGKGSKALQRCVQILVRLLLTNDLQRNYSLAGRQKKQAFKELRMGKVLLAAVEEKTGQDSDSVEKAVGRYLAGAPARAKEAKERANPQDDSTDGTTVTFHFNVEPEVS